MAIKRADRARQFMPFAALTGYSEIIRQREKIIEPRKELSEDEAAVLSEKMSNIKKGMLIKITYYDNDGYDTMVGLVSKIDVIYRILTIVKTNVHLDDIIDVEVIDDSL